MIGAPLLILVLVQLTSAVDDMCGSAKAHVLDLYKRWPFIKGEDTLDDSTLKLRNYYARDYGTFLDYPPGVGHCGGKYPIWSKERKANVSVMCIQNETSTCFKEMEIETQLCPFAASIMYEVFRLHTDVAGSVFCFQPNTCNDRLCKNGGTCTVTREGMSCSCPEGFSGPTCEGGRYGNMIGTCAATSYYHCAYPRVALLHKCEDREIYALFRPLFRSAFCFECNEGPLDILITEDVSSSVEKHDNDTARNFAINFVTGIDVSKEGNNVAYITFASKPHVEFYLNAHDSQDGVLSAIRSQVPPGGGTNLDPAVKLGELNVFREQNGDRPEARNVVLLITDGKYKDGGKVNDSILELRRMAEVFVVTVTPTMDTAAVMKIASDPTANHVYPVDKALRSITTMLFDPCDSKMPV